VLTHCVNYITDKASHIYVNYRKLSSIHHLLNYFLFSHFDFV